ncbi:MAG: hypothetical protein A2521_13245 [Deltaproteobacteria bacterium RIFOXYD12_FULL_57_12]|nr:MAG: hypothetical protein A2521_13245 [Deltaproteobacteria bacterium RIFOXYD12_FULL_57_12]
MYDIPARERKARTMVAILEEFLPNPLHELDLLDIGASTGIIDNYLSRYFGQVVGIDIDTQAIAHAQKTFHRGNLKFQTGDALDLPFAEERFDVVICAHVYEHVPDARRMFVEILRVLKPAGVCYFAGGNRLMLNEPHYHLPLLSVVPRPLAHIYMRLAGKGTHYYERHLSYWGLKSLVKQFARFDYTVATVSEPQKYYTDYMITPHGIKQKIALAVLCYFYWASPGYIWLLQKTAER